MSTWETLVASSTLPDNDTNTALDHLNNLGSGGSGETIYMIGATSANITNITSTTIIEYLSSSVNSTLLTAEITNKISTNIDETTETT